MLTTHLPFTFGALRLHRVDFDPATLQPADLLWLPHHAQLADCGRKRQAEHLAGRIAAVHALREVGEKQVPLPGAQGQPLWPAPWYGSISHCERTAIAAVAPYPLGVDIERLFTPALAAELCSSVVNASEQRLLKQSALPFAHALTLAFSAKESAFKAFSTYSNGFPGFHSATLVAIDDLSVRLRFSADFSPTRAGDLLAVEGRFLDQYLITCTRPQ